jgi:hypothetical protein
VNSSTLQLSLTPPIYRFDKSAQATTSLTPGGRSASLVYSKKLMGVFHQIREVFFRVSLEPFFVEIGPLSDIAEMRKTS